MTKTLGGPALLTFGLLLVTLPLLVACDPEPPDTDAGPQLDGSACEPPAEACDGDDVDSCATGTYACVAGALVCEETGAAQVERCDGVDNDCDGVVDEGEAALDCDLPGAVGICSAGSCAPASCDPGFGDCDAAAENGCEVDLRSEATHCGACGFSCATGEACVDGRCDRGFVHLAANRRHACAIRGEDGSVWCWGQNTAGQLGDGSTTLRPYPVRAQGVSDAAQVAMGIAHTCALLTDGSVLCWGENTHGQLGDGSTEARSGPVEVALGGAAAAELAAGNEHTCARMEDGSVLCWGNGALGQLGDGGSTDRPTPVAVQLEGGAELSGASAVGAGASHACAVTLTGLLCWGDNTSGQLGAGDTMAHAGAVSVPVAGAVAVDGGETHTCALDATSQVYCWGGNASGQIGDGGSETRLAPVRLGLPAAGARGVVAAGTHTCVRTPTEVYCWGENTYGQVGAPGFVRQRRPYLVPGLGTTSELAVGLRSSCALEPSGRILCWGSAFTGQLGDGGVGLRALPHAVALTGLSGLRSFDAGGDRESAFGCMLDGEGAAHCWGWNLSGQLGDASTEQRQRPTPVSGAPAASQIAAGRAHACALSDAGEVFCWGANDAGQLGDGGTEGRLTAARVTGLSGASQLALGRDFGCALTETGQLMCWGSNDAGQLGEATPEMRATAAPVPGLTGVLAFSLGARHGCALTEGGSILCWGADARGQLGRGGDGGAAPAPIDSELSFVGVSAGGRHTCAWTEEGAAWCWGDNSQGQLGDGSTEARSRPTRIDGIEGVEEVAAGGDLERGHSCARAAGGRTFCWGNNGSFELGTGSALSENRLTPGLVLGLPAGGGGPLRLAAGHSCVGAGETIFCWGNNGRGQLGDGLAGRRFRPAPLLGQ